MGWGKTFISCRNSRPPYAASKNVSFPILGAVFISDRQNPVGQYMLNYSEKKPSGIWSSFILYSDNYRDGESLDDHPPFSSKRCSLHPWSPGLFTINYLVTPRISYKKKKTFSTQRLPICKKYRCQTAKRSVQSHWHVYKKVREGHSLLLFSPHQTRTPIGNECVTGLVLTLLPSNCFMKCLIPISGLLFLLFVSSVNTLKLSFIISWHPLVTPEKFAVNQIVAPL